MTSDHGFDIGLYTTREGFAHVRARVVFNDLSDYVLYGPERRIGGQLPVTQAPATDPVFKQDWQLIETGMKNLIAFAFGQKLDPKYV